MKLKATKDFRWAHGGSRVEQYQAGQVFETEDQDLIGVSATEGWAEQVENAKAPKSNKAIKAAPENK